jgi:predicted DNA-binding antitoxin AbrB/MazE fold protein
MWPDVAVAVVLRAWQALRMSADPKRIRALFTGGVFRPLDRVSLPDNSEVEISIQEPRGFDAWGQAHVARVRARATAVSPDEIDRDVAEAVRESRADRRHGA